MAAPVKYAYLKQQTWLFRRNDPKDAAMVLGVAALKQSLKTSDVATARVHAAEVNLLWESRVAQARQAATEAVSQPETSSLSVGWQGDPKEALARLRATLEASGVTKPQAFPALGKSEKISVRHSIVDDQRRFEAPPRHPQHPFTPGHYLGHFGHKRCLG